MQIIEKKINEINPYKNNPRNNDAAVDKVAASIQEFGFKVPIVIDKNNIVVTGHARLKAAKQIGLEKVPVIIADDLTPDQIKAFRIVDNKTAEFATWDLELLQTEIEDIEVDMSEFGLGHDFAAAAESIDLDGQQDAQRDGKVYICPKCGFEFEVKE